MYCETITSPSSAALDAISKETRVHPWEKLSDEGKTHYFLEPVMLTGQLEGKIMQLGLLHVSVATVQTF